MPRAKSPVAVLRARALRHPETVEGVACEGTALESRTIKTRDRAFLFLKESDARLKLRESLREAVRLAKQDPARYQAGAGGWVKVSFAPGAAPDYSVLERWVDESYRLFAESPAKKAKAKKKPGARRAT